MCTNTQMKYPIIAHWGICGSLLEIFNSFYIGLLIEGRYYFQLVSNFDRKFLRDEM